MALFQKNPFTTKETKPLYTLGLNNTVLIVGLGNPGKEYENTRHNLGFLCVDNFTEKNEFPAWIEKKDLKCLHTDTNLGGTHVIAIKPNTFMNLSGEAVQAVASFYKIPESKIIVVHDELDVPFGQIRTRLGGGAAGHNGIKSIIQSMGEDFGRVRIGIGPKTPGADLPAGRQVDSADFVLGKLSKDEQGHIPAMINEINTLLTEYVFSGELPEGTRNFVF